MLRDRLLELPACDLISLHRRSGPSLGFALDLLLAPGMDTNHVVRRRTFWSASVSAVGSGVWTFSDLCSSPPRPHRRHG